jgi:hypothetical protein
VPLYARVIPLNGSKGKEWQKSLITGWTENILLVSSSPGKEKKELVLQLRELAGRSTFLSLFNKTTGKRFKIIPVNALNEPLTPPSPWLGPYQSKFFRVTWN